MSPETPAKKHQRTERRVATAKIKVSELAKSLGMSNAEMLELCKANNVAAKTPQSTLVEAFVPMLKRKAEAAGLVREVAPVEEEKPAKKAPARAASVRKAPAKAVQGVVRAEKAVAKRVASAARTAASIPSHSRCSR